MSTPQQTPNPQVSVVDHQTKATTYKPSHRAESKTGGRLRLAGAALSVTAATVGVGLGLDTLGDNIPLVKDLAADGSLDLDTGLGLFGDPSDFELVAQGGQAVDPDAPMWQSSKLPASETATGGDLPLEDDGVDIIDGVVVDPIGPGSPGDGGTDGPDDGSDGGGDGGPGDGGTDAPSNPGTDGPGTGTPGLPGGGLPGTSGPVTDSIDETVDEVTDTVDGGSGQGDVIDETVDEVTDTVDDVLGDAAGALGNVTAPVTGILGGGEKKGGLLGSALGKLVVFAALLGEPEATPAATTEKPTVTVELTSLPSVPVLPTAVPSILVTESAWTVAP